MIPNIQPPPQWQPQGWSPNALAPAASELAVDVEAAFELMRLALVPGFLYLHSFELTQAETVGSATTPVLVMPAPGPNLTIVPIYISAIWANSTAFATAGNIFFRYDGFPAKAVSDTNGYAAINANRRTVANFPWLSMFHHDPSPGSAVANKGIRLHSTIDWTGAGVQLQHSIRITYALLSTPQ